MKLRTSELSGAALDYAVALCEGFGPDTYMRNIDIRRNVEGKVSALLVPIDRAYITWLPSQHWAQGGPIMERENICIRGIQGGFHAWYHQRPPKTHGPTMLIAAMRCYVASKLGEEVELPDGL